LRRAPPAGLASSGTGIAATAGTPAAGATLSPPPVARRRRRRGSASPLGRAPADAARGFWVQLGAFRERDGAESFRRRIAADGDASWLEPRLAIFGDAVVYRVQAGPYPSRDEAESAAQRARAALAIVPVVVERR
jgi:rare lipoprotein A